MNSRQQPQCENPPTSETAPDGASPTTERECPQEEEASCAGSERPVDTDNRVVAGNENKKETGTTTLSPVANPRVASSDKEAAILEKGFEDAKTRSYAKTIDAFVADASSRSFNENLNLNAGLDGIEPLPLARGEARRPASTPGAFHARPAYQAGSAQNDNPNDAEQPAEGSDNNSSNTMNEMGVIGGAVLVEPGDEILGVMEGGGQGPATEAGEEPEINQNHQAEVLEATIMPDNPPSSTHKSCPRYLWLGVLLVAMVGVAIILAIAFGAFSSSKAATDSPLTAQEQLYYPPFLDDLTEDVRQGIQTIGSPLYLANKWMVQDPYLIAYPKKRQMQRFMLATLYYYTGGDYWLQNDDWLSYETSECNWFYRTSEAELEFQPTCDKNESIITLGLAGNNLTGYLPHLTSYFNNPPFPDVRFVDIAHNNISGVIPSLAGTEFTEVYVASNNSFESALLTGGSGTVRDSALRVVKYDSNQVRSTFYGFMFPLMRHLEVYNVTGNLIDGKIGSQLKSCKNLTYLGMGHNLFGSTVPTQLGLIPGLKEIDISGNPYLEGTIPSELGALDSLVKLDLADSSLTGFVPEEICTQGRLEVLANCSQVQCCE